MSLSTCRFCKRQSIGGVKMVKYGVRHYAHYGCYLDAGKKLADLKAWQIEQCPWHVLRVRGLTEEAYDILNAGKLGPENNSATINPNNY